MLLAERAESERLRQIIKKLQRHRFGRRAESLPEEQLQRANLMHRLRLDRLLKPPLAPVPNPAQMVLQWN